MKIARLIITNLYTIWVLSVFTVFMILLLPLIILPLLLGRNFGRWSYLGLYIWSWIFSMLTFIRYEIIGRENINRSRSYIYISNHTSFLDAPGLSLGIPTQFRPLAKKELKKIPIFGWIVRVVTVVVDRSNPVSRTKSIEMLKSFLKKGISILIFPEGTQNRTSEPLQPFYDGAFRIALQTQATILPIVIVNAGKLMPPNAVSIRPGKIKVLFGKPIEVSGSDKEDLLRIKNQTYNQMLMMMENATKSQSRRQPVPSQ